MTEHEQLRFDAPIEDPVAVYIASGLTKLSDDQLAVVELLSGLVAEFCSRADVQVHQPIMHTHPNDHSDLDSEDVHDADFRTIVASDAVVAICDYPSWGAGKELAWAERLRLPVLGLLRQGADVSRLVRGAPSDHEIHTWRYHGDVQAACDSFFLKRKQQLEAHRRLRNNRTFLWAPPLGRLRTAYDALSESEQRATAATAQLTPRRIGELLASPMFLAEASLDEVQALGSALGLPASHVSSGELMPELSARNLTALEAAAVVEEWDGSTVMHLQRRALVEIAKAGTRRLRFNDPQDWIDFGSSGA
jgi:nucleoside 2-deoxyribosyltransferase